MATDAQLVKACLDGQIEAFGGLVERYRDAVYGYCYARVGDLELAKDLAQEILVSAYRALPQLRAPERFAGWLRRIAENACKAARRRNVVAEQSLETHAPPACGDIADRLTTRLAVHTALRNLPEPCRVVVSLFYLGAHTCEEIARFLSVPESTVKGRLRDGRARLRKQLLGKVKDVLREEALPPDFGGQVMKLIRDVRLRDDGRHPVIVLGDERGKALPIWIGEPEADALWMALGDIRTPRPLTYDLFLRALSAFGIRMERVEVADIRENTVIAALVLTNGKRQESVDARPSDAINLALRAKAPVFLSDGVAKTMIEHAEAEQRFADHQPSWARPLRVVHTILEKAVEARAGRILIRQARTAREMGSVQFVVGAQRKEVLLLPPEAIRAVQGELANMAGIKVKPGTKSQSGRVRTRYAGRDCNLAITLTRLGVNILVQAAKGSRRK